MSFIVQDVQQDGYTLEPLICINPDCDEPAPSVIYDQRVCDAVCEHCGEWQEEFLT